MDEEGKYLNELMFKINTLLLNINKYTKDEIELSLKIICLDYTKFRINQMLKREG